MYGTFSQKGSRILAECHNSYRKIPAGSPHRLISYRCLATGGALATFGYTSTFDGPHSRQRANEAATVGRLPTLVTLQNQYMALYPSNGFACELPLLRPNELRDKVNYDPLGFLITGTQSGYKFSVVKGIVALDATRAKAHYQSHRSPYRTRHITGFWAFCADESGVIWYDEAGSATQLLRVPTCTGMSES